MHSVRGIKAGAEATGIYHVLANKGACCVVTLLSLPLQFLCSALGLLTCLDVFQGGLVGSFTVGDVRIALICSHLAAHEGKMKKRSSNVTEILGGTMVSPP